KARPRSRVKGRRGGPCARAPVAPLRAGDPPPHPATDVPARRASASASATVRMSEGIVSELRRSIAPALCPSVEAAEPWPRRGRAPAGSRAWLAFGRDAMDPRAENAHASTPSARKREALELFAGLPRRYDLLSAALSS